ncbi:uncharacterized protein LOC115006399 isoform X2 [Cottoperca gobio]|nr:uncharacterized protein LOC115006399 isoform X2 [Cottoperca gobio]
MMCILGATYNATLSKGGKSMKSKIISVKDSIKPKTPTIISVKESNGNFQIKWNANTIGSFGQSLKANVTYHKKGDAEKVPVHFKPTTVNGLNYYEILGRHLKPSTTYAVSVKSYTDWSEKYSDSSEEIEFTTPMSPNDLSLAIIVILCVAAVIISAAIYGCYLKLKTRWRDVVAKCPNPKLLLMHPSKQGVLKPVSPIISSVRVEPHVPEESKPWLKDTSGGSPQQSSESTGSSCLSYATTEPANIIAGVQDALEKLFPNISPISTLTTNPPTESNKDQWSLLSPSYNPCDVRADIMSVGSDGFDNQTYFLSPNCVDQQAPAGPLVNLPPVVSSLVPTEMSYDQCNADSLGCSHAEGSSLSSVFRGTNTIASCDSVFRFEAECESFDEAVLGVTKLHEKTEGGIICDENPFYRCAPAGSHSLPPVHDDYQPFQDLVKQPDILFSEERSGEKEERLTKYPDKSFTKMPQSFVGPVAPGSINNVHVGQGLSELQRHLLSGIPADQSMPLITESGYHSV